jgi:hypothetical protein
MSVREVSGGKREQEKGRNLDESHVSEYNGGAGLEIQIPTHGHGKHLQAEA